MNIKNKILILLNIIGLIILTFVISTWIYKYIIVKQNSFVIKLNNLIQQDFSDHNKELNQNDNLKQPSVLILIGPVGINSNIIKSVFELPKEIVLGISPYSSNFDEIIKKSVDYNHEVMINIPMEPTNFPLDDPGPYALLNKYSEENNKNLLQSLLKKNILISGIYSDANEVYTSNQDNFSMIIELLKNDKLNYIYGYGQENVFCKQTAKQADYPLITADILIDKDIDNENINIQLSRLEVLAKSNKFAVGIARPYPLSISLISKWIETLNYKTIKLITIKELINSNWINE